MSAEDAVPSRHRVDWLLDNARDPYARFSCTANEGARCRSWCAEGCEEFCTDQRGHVWEDTGSCRVIVFLTECGTPGELFIGDNETPVRSGPIETEWDGDVYLWQYAEADQ